MDDEKLRLWKKRIYIFTKLLQITLLVAICIMSAIRIRENRLFLLIFLPSLIFLGVQVFLFRLRIRINVLLEEKWIFLVILLCYSTIFGIIMMYDDDDNTIVNGSASQNISEPNQIPETIQTTDNETFSYSGGERLNKTEGSWKAAENFNNKVIGYEDDDSSYKNNNEGKEKSVLKPIYISTFFVVVFTVLFHLFTWVLAKNIYFPVANPQNYAIPLRSLAFSSDNTGLGPNPNVGPSSPHPLRLHSIVTPRTHSAATGNIYAHPIGEAGQRTLPLEREFYLRNNLSSSAATSLIGDSLQRRSTGTSSEFDSRGIIPE